MSKTTISTPTLNDIPILWKWGEENWQLWGDDIGKWFSKKSLTRMITDPEDDIFLVARNGAQLVGMCFTTVIRDWAFCYGLFVEENHRGQRIGKRLLDETHRLLKEKGVENLILLVDTKNARAEKFYRREGFRKGFGFYMMIKEFETEER